MTLTPHELKAQEQAAIGAAEKLEKQRQQAREQPAETKLDRLRKLIRLAPTQQRIGPRNRGPEPAFQDSHYLCCMIDLRKIEQILGEKP